VLDQGLLRELQTAEGEAALQAAALLAPSEESFLEASQRLAGRFPERLARAAVEQAILRRRARAKFGAADHLFFLREALEQATSERVALHRAQRFSGAPWIVDFGCGLGGDALALSTVGRVVAIDRDRLRLAVLQANARAVGRTDRIWTVHADLSAEPIRPRPSALAFADPARRARGVRARSSSRSEPPLHRIVEIVERFEGSAVKLSPAVDRAELTEWPAEIEFVSVGGELKEATLWFGSLRMGVRRATILPQGVSLEGDVEPEVDVGPLDSYLVEPDPAVMRAGLVRRLASQLGARQIEPDLALLTTPGAVETPFGRCYQIAEVLPSGLKPLRQALRARGIGPVTLKKRGSAIDTETFRHRLRLGEGEEATVLLTRAGGRRVALLLRRVDPSLAERRA